MSALVTCDRCKREGRRRIGQIAPDNWAYAEVADENGDTNIIYACSKTCQHLTWHQGPGTLDLSEIPPDAPFLTILTADGEKEYSHLVSCGARIYLGGLSLEPHKTLPGWMILRNGVFPG